MSTLKPSENMIPLRFGLKKSNQPVLYVEYNKYQNDGKTAVKRHRKIPVRDIQLTSQQVKTPTTVNVQNLVESLQKRHNDILKHVSSSSISRILVKLLARYPHITLINTIPQSALHTDETKVSGTLNLNKLGDEELSRIKKQMDVEFEKNKINPGQPGYQYNIQKDYGLPKDDNEWDEEDTEDTAKGSSIPVQETVDKSHVLTNQQAKLSTVAPVNERVNESIANPPLQTLPPPKPLSQLSSLAGLPSLQPMQQTKLSTLSQDKDTKKRHSRSLEKLKQDSEKLLGMKLMDDLLREDSKQDKNETLASASSPEKSNEKNSITSTKSLPAPDSKTDSKRTNLAIPTASGISPSVLHATSNTLSPMPVRSDLFHATPTSSADSASSLHRRSLEELAAKTASPSLSQDKVPSGSSELFDSKKEDEFFKPVPNSSFLQTEIKPSSNVTLTASAKPPIANVSKQLPTDITSKVTDTNKDLEMEEDIEEEISDFGGSLSENSEKEDAVFSNIIKKSNERKPSPLSEKKESSTDSDRKTGFTQSNEKLSIAQARSDEAKLSLTTSSVPTSNGAVEKIVSPQLNTNSSTASPATTITPTPTPTSMAVPSLLAPLQPLQKPGNSLLGSLPPLKGFTKLEPKPLLSPSIPMVPSSTKQMPTELESKTNPPQDSDDYDFDEEDAISVPGLSDDDEGHAF